MENENVGTRIKKMRTLRGFSLQDIADRVDVNRSSVMRWERGETAKIKLPLLEKLALLLYTSPEYLMMGDSNEDLTRKNAFKANNFCFLPLIGSVCEGSGLLAHENIIKYEVADKKYSTKEYFYLRVSGDSMSPKLDDGDLVIVKRQMTIDSGDVGVFLVDGSDGIIKKARYGRDYIELNSFNPYYPVRRFENSEMSRVYIIGKIVESRRIW